MKLNITNKLKKINFIISVLIIIPLNLYSYILPLTNEKYLQELIHLIKKSKQQILIAHQYFYNDIGTQKLIDTLIKTKLKNKKLEIKILLENELPQNRNILDIFNLYYIETKLDSDKKYSHLKLVIIDGKYVIIGSTNFSKESLTENNETNVLIKDEKTAKFFIEYFYHLWYDTKFNINQNFSLTDNIIPVVNNMYYNILKQFLITVKSKIYIIMYEIKCNPEYQDNKVNKLINLLIDCFNKNIDVKILLEKSNYNDDITKINQTTFEYLKNKGISVKFDREDIITHSKLVLLNDDTVILGSFNWTYSSFFLNNETGIVIRDKSIYNYFLKYFYKLWFQKQ